MRASLRVLWLSVCAPVMLAAQGSSSVLRGRVMEGADSLMPVANAEVELVGTGYRRITDARGVFVFSDAPVGEYDVLVRRLGYKAERRSVTLRSGDATVADFRLMRVVQTLTEVTVEGRRLKVPARFGEVYERAAHGWGKFFTRDDIQARNPTDVKALLSAIPGVLINDRGITFQRC
ncbi:MAG TPA: carboxypeptidase-like regulatory domain-containing protein [Gemmatimonadaceae bacterium]